MHLDSRLNWKHHVRQKKFKIKDKLRKLYWLIGKYSELDLTSKRLLYIAIIKPIWTYGNDYGVVPVSPILRLFDAVKTLLSVLLLQYTGKT